MKKIIAFTLIIAMAVMLCSCSFIDSYKAHIYSYNWQLTSVTKGGQVIALSEKDPAHPDAVVVDILLSASSGEYVNPDGTKITTVITIIDKINNKLSVSLYQTVSVGFETSIYNVTINEYSGVATLTLTREWLKVKSASLVIELDGYTLYFEPIGLANSVADIRRLIPTAEIMDGLSIRGSRVNECLPELKAWLGLS